MLPTDAMFANLTITTSGNGLIPIVMLILVNCSDLVFAQKCNSRPIQKIVATALPPEQEHPVGTAGHRRSFLLLF